MPHLQQHDAISTLHPLAAPRISIGRHTDNDIVLMGDLRVSRRHAELEDRGQLWILRDLGSRNGTLLNGKRITESPLRGGDRIAIGSAIFSFCSGSDPMATIADDRTAASAVRPELSAREREILALLATGSTDQSIADALFISLSTVRSHLDRIRDKTGCRRRPELTRLAMDLGLDA